MNHPRPFDWKRLVVQDEVDMRLSPPKSKYGSGTTLLDKVIIILIFAQLLILDYLGVSAIPKRITFLLIVSRFCIKGISFSPGDIALSIALIILTCLNLACNGVDASILLYNMKYFLYPYAYIAFLASYAKENRASIRSTLRRLMPYINLYFIITMLVAFFQFKYHILIAANNGEYNSTYGSVYWMDAAGGLFRFTGTHVLCMFTVFVVLYNLWFYQTDVGNRRFIVLGIVIIESIGALFFGSLNGNRALYFMLPIGVILWCLPSLKPSRCRIKQSTILFMTGFVLIVIAAVSSQGIRTLFDERILRQFSYMLSSWGQTSDLIGPGERIAIIYTALNMPSTWLFGMGLGACRRAEPYFLGFKHFGLSDAGVILVLLGLWLATVYLSKFLKNYLAIAGCKSFGDLLPATLLIGYFVITLIYTRPVTDVALSTTFALISLMFGLKWEDAGNRDSSGT